MHLITTPHTSQAILWFSHSISKHLFLLLRTKYTSIRFIPAQLFRVPLVWHFTLTSPFSNPCWGYHGITLSLWKFTIWWHIVLPSVCFLYPQIDCKLLESTIQSLSLSISISGLMCIEHLQYRQHIKCLCHLILFSGQPWKAGIFTIFLKMRLREAQWFAQGRAARQWQSWESNPGSLTHNLHAVLPP